MLYAVPLNAVFLDETSAAAASMSDPNRMSPNVKPGQTVWTASTSFTVVSATEWPIFALAPGYAFTKTPVRESIGAGAVIVLGTDGGDVLIDLGIQGKHESPFVADLADAIAMEITDSTLSRTFAEAVLLPGAKDGYLVPQLARTVGFKSVRVTLDQFADPKIQASIDELNKSSGVYLDWLESNLRTTLDQNRAEWEVTQPIAPNEGLRDERWKRHVNAVVAEMRGKHLAPVVRQIVDEGLGVVRMANETDQSLPVVDTEPSAPYLDLSDTQWEPDDSGGVLAVLSGDTMHLIPSKGLLWRPKPAAPDAKPVEAKPVEVEGLAPTKTGPTPLAGRPAQPLLAVSAVGKDNQTIVRTGNGPGVLIDAGGASHFMPDQAVTEMLARLNLTTIDAILPTHGHIDHVRQLEAFIRRFGIRSDRLAVAKDWIDAAHVRDAVFRMLSTTNDPVLKGLGYGPEWANPPLGVPLRQLPVDVPATGVVKVTMQLAGGKVDIYADAEGHRDFRDTTKSRQARHGDSASLMHILSSDAVSHKVAVLGDMRGTDISAMAASMGHTQFGEALQGVKIIIGFGHHMGPDAARTSADVAATSCCSKRHFFATAN